MSNPADTVNDQSLMTGINDASSIEQQSVLMISSSSFLSIDDIIAGSALLFSAFIGIILHILEVLAMCKLVKNVTGFRFILTLSIADLGMLFFFGIIPGVAIFMPSLHDTLTAWKYGMHIVADTVWFSCCYLNVFIAATRFTCVVFPLHFRMLRRQCTCWLIGIAIWTIALAQSCAANSAPWFVAIWYMAGTYGMSCDWLAYAQSGTRTYYMSLNGLVIGANLLIYTVTAVIIFTKKAVRYRFFNALFKSKCSKIVDNQSPNEQQHNENFNTGEINVPIKRPSVAVVEVQTKNTREALQRRSYSNTNMLIRTVKIARSVRNCEASATHAMEIRLVVPCCVNALIFIVAQLFIMNGGIGPEGKWSDLSVMLIFCLQSIAPPFLRLIFSKVLRHHIVALLKVKRPTNNGTRPPAGADIERHQQEHKKIWIETVPVATHAH